MPGKILIADDDLAVVETLKAILERFDYDVDSATNGEECIKKILLHKPDLLLLDIMMPKMDGYSFLVAIKELKALTGSAPDMPVIVITGNDTEINRSLVSHENIRDYLRKPFDIPELLDKIKNTLKK